MADVIGSSLLYITNEDSTGAQASNVLEDGAQINILCPSEHIIQPEEIHEPSAVQMIPVQDLNSQNGQEYLLLAPMSVLKDNEHQINSETNSENRYVPANRILAESVRGLFFSTDSQSSFKSGEENTSNEDYNQDESSNEYGPTGKRQRRGNTSSDDGKKVDPFSDECRIPLPGSVDNPYFDSKTFVRRRNERERARVRSVNEGFERLRAHLPFDGESKHRRLSKVETLQCAIQYIQHLKEVLENGE